MSRLGTQTPPPLAHRLCQAAVCKSWAGSHPGPPFAPLSLDHTRVWLTESVTTCGFGAVTMPSHDPLPRWQSLV